MGSGANRGGTVLAAEMVAISTSLESGLVCVRMSVLWLWQVPRYHTASLGNIPGSRYGRSQGDAGTNTGGALNIERGMHRCGSLPDVPQAISPGGGGGVETLAVVRDA